MRFLKNIKRDFYPQFNILLGYLKYYIDCTSNHHDTFDLFRMYTNISTRKST